MQKSKGKAWCVCPGGYGVLVCGTSLESGGHPGGKIWTTLQRRVRE
jgi:hypothetical protein